MMRLIDINLVLEHEKIRESKVLELVRHILVDGFVRTPIVVEDKHFVVLDGHHRLNALKRLGCKRIPSFIVDYSRDDIKVGSWRGGLCVSKELVLRAGISGRKLMPKTSRHYIPKRPQNVNIPLSRLR